MKRGSYKSIIRPTAITRGFDFMSFSAVRRVEVKPSKEVADHTTSILSQSGLAALEEK